MGHFESIVSASFALLGAHRDGALFPVVPFDTYSSMVGTPHVQCSTNSSLPVLYRHDGIRELPEFNAVPSDGIDWSH